MEVYDQFYTIFDDSKGTWILLEGTHESAITKWLTSTT